MNSIPTNLNEEQAKILTALLQDAKRLLRDAASLSPISTAKKWVAQYGPLRPVEARVSAPKTLHDRAIFVDGDKAWTLTQSLKDFAKRSPAEIVRADDTASLKIDAYELIWASARSVI